MVRQKDTGRARFAFEIFMFMKCNVYKKTGMMMIIFVLAEFGKVEQGVISRDEPHHHPS